MALTYEKATTQDINTLSDLRIAYLQEDLGTLNDTDLSLMQTSLPSYYKKHLNQDLMVYVAKENDDIISCAFLLIIEKPMSPAFITGKTGTVLNVYTKPNYRRKGIAKQLLTMLLADSKALDISVVELKATEDGYSLYKSIGFEDVVAKYHNMKIVLQ